MKYSKVLILLFCLAVFSCRKKEISGIPYVQVYKEVHINDPQFFRLNVVGGWEYISGGSRGIFIYRKTNDEFVALDRHCTYNVNSDCGRVSVDSSGIQLVDTCCSSVFGVSNGEVVSGPAGVPLKQYSTDFVDNVLYVSN